LIPTVFFGLHTSDGNENIKGGTASRPDLFLITNYNQELYVH
jgi:hypothetical protein